MLFYAGKLDSLIDLRQECYGLHGLSEAHFVGKYAVPSKKIISDSVLSAAEENIKKTT